MKNLYRYKWFRKLNNKGSDKMFYVQTFLIVFVMTIMGTGFALLSENLTLGSTASISKTFDIEISNILQTESTGSAIGTTSYSYLSSEFNVELLTLDATITYAVTFSNNGTYNGLITSIVENLNTNPNILYDIRGTHEGSIIKWGIDTRMYITFYYDPDLSSLPSNTSSSVNITTQIESTDLEIGTYIINEYKNIFYVDGNDEPVSGTWRDRKSNYHVTLDNVTHDETDKAYAFSSNSCGYTSSEIIPRTGDFTLETYFETGGDITSDQAIVAKKSTTIDKDPGRFKINVFHDGNNNNPKVIRMFLNDGSNAYEYNYNTISTVPLTRYYVQLVRHGEYMYLYLNGILVGTKNFSSSIQIAPSGTLQLGCWTNKTTQNFFGKIFSVRVYDRALETEVLLENYRKDTLNDGQGVITQNSIIEILTQRDLVTSSNGLYYESQDNRYIYRGNSSYLNNYFAENGNLWRIMSIESDESIKLVKVSNLVRTAFDAANNRSLSNYCTNQANGCNVFLAGDLNITVGSTPMTDTIANDSTLATLLKTTIYNDLSSTIKGRILTKEWDVGLASNENVSYSQLVNTIGSSWSDSNGKNTWTSNIGTISAIDVMDAFVGGRSYNTSNTSSSNYLTALSNKNDTFVWTMNGIYNKNPWNSWDTFAIVTGTSIGPRRASRADQVASPKTYYYYATPVVYIRGNFIPFGDGSMLSPFTFGE